MDRVQKTLYKFQEQWRAAPPNATLFLANVPFGLHKAKWDEVAWTEADIIKMLIAALSTTSALSFVFILQVPLMMMTLAYNAFQKAGYQNVLEFFHSSPGTPLNGVVGGMNRSVLAQYVLPHSTMFL